MYYISFHQDQLRWSGKCLTPVSFCLWHQLYSSHHPLPWLSFGCSCNPFHITAAGRLCFPLDREPAHSPGPGDCSELCMQLSWPLLLNLLGSWLSYEENTPTRDSGSWWCDLGTNGSLPTCAWTAPVQELGTSTVSEYTVWVGIPGNKAEQKQVELRNWEK